MGLKSKGKDHVNQGVIYLNSCLSLVGKNEVMYW